MRNIKPKKYAISLYETLYEAEKGKVPELIKSFIALLIRNQDLHKADKIIKAFTTYADIKEKRVEVTLYSAHHLHAGLKELVIEQLKKSLNKDITVQEAVDPSLIGGLILKYDDVVVDGSIKKRIELLAQSLRS
jgi:F-type H+-transporting ATPase subunit delta